MDINGDFCELPKTCSSASSSRLVTLPQNIHSKHPCKTPRLQQFCTQVHLGYCKFLTPKVEKHLVAHKHLLKYFLTPFVTLKLLRGVSTWYAYDHVVYTLLTYFCTSAHSTGLVSVNTCRKLGWWMLPLSYGNVCTWTQLRRQINWQL